MDYSDKQTKNPDPVPISDPQYLKHITEALYQNNFELEKERGRIDKILFNIAEIVFAIDENYNITLFNNTAELVFQNKFNEVKDQNIDKYVSLYDENNKKDLKALDYAFKGNDFSVQRVKINEVGQENQYYKLKSTQIDYKSNKEAVIVMSNITPEVEMDKRKDEFISIASHELKTPISIIKNNIWMFFHITKKKFTQRENRFLNEINEGLIRLQKIVNNLLDISRIEQGRLVVNMEDLDIYDETLKIMDNFKELAEKKKLKLISPQKPSDVNFTCTVDKERFDECIENLVGNAIKYTNKGEVQLYIEEWPKIVKISVRDTGAGIPVKDYSKIFTKFGRASEGLKLDGATTGSSTGLGLYITKNYVQAMGGEIGFTSLVGTGSTFWFTVRKSTRERHIQTAEKSGVIRFK
ncbi:MAG: HAMP domain-containing histidine kinase [Niabella sp.]|nr:MAG: HAMP domain-containing histidine kinase [Niabella sp.]